MIESKDSCWEKQIGRTAVDGWRILAINMAENNEVKPLLCRCQLALAIEVSC